MPPKNYFYTLLGILVRLSKTVNLFALRLRKAELRDTTLFFHIWYKKFGPNYIVNFQ
jgi:hypothetical protein